MARIDKILSFKEDWDRWLGDLKPGSTMLNFPGPDPDDRSVEHAEARLLHARFGALRDLDLKPASWKVVWARGALRPMVHLSSDLFAHVADMVEAA